MRVIELIHEVKDFEAWKIGFDAHKSTRQDYGLQDVELMTNADNRNLVTVVMEETIAGGFEKFSEESDMKTIMEKYGVLGKPEFKFFEKELV